MRIELTDAELSALMQLSGYLQAQQVQRRGTFLQFRESAAHARKMKALQYWTGIVNAVVYKAQQASGG